MKCNITKHFINVYTDWSSEKKIHHWNNNLLPLDTYIETTQVYCTHQTERKKYKGLMVQWTHTCTHAWLQLQVGLMGWVRWTWQIPTELDRPWPWVVVPQQDVPLRTCSKFVKVCYVLSRSVAFFLLYYRSLPSWLPWQFFYCLKLCPDDHGNHGELRLSTPFLYVVIRWPRFVHGDRNRDWRGRR